jgi:four helix bundle protein
MKNFRTYQLSLQFNRNAKFLNVPSHLRNQLQRASSSVTLNLAEGSGRVQKGDQRRSYEIALGSLREVQAILDLCEESNKEMLDLVDCLAANLFKLIRSTR